MREEELIDRLRRSEAAAYRGALPVGTVLGDWRLAAYIAHGGTSDVYCAEHVALGMVVAVKVLRDGDRKDRRERFRREARILSELRSMSFPRFYAYGTSEGHDYLVEELLEPRDLPKGRRSSVRFLLALCEAVGELHGRGVVHCDIKPANILFRPETGDPVLVDLGLAVSPSEDSRGGTLGYSAPEQFLGGEITPAADIHALGVLAERLQLGYRGVIRRATSSIPSERFGDVVAFARALRRCIWARRLAWVGGIASVVAVILAVIWPRTEPSARTQRLRKLPELEAVEAAETQTLSEELPAKAFSEEPSGDLILAGQTIVRTEPLRVPEGKTLRVIGPGTLDAVISGGKGSRLWLANCVVLNRSKTIFPADPLRYELSGSVYLNFVNADKPELDEAEMGKYFNPYVETRNDVRYRGPLTISGLIRQRNSEYFQSRGR